MAVVAGVFVGEALAQPMIPGPDLEAPEPVRVVHAPESRQVRGVIGERGSVNPVSGATALDEVGEIAVTDIDGYFTIDVVPTSKELTIAAPGYATISVRIPRGDERVRIDLVRTTGAEVIEVHDKAPEQTKPLSYQLTAEEIRVIPGAGNDILRAIMALPGVARIPYSFGGVVLRGQSPRDSAVYLDGIEVPIAFHFGGVTSFYPGGMLKDLTVASGGFDASYGRAQGGIVSLITREPRTDRWRMGGSVGLLDSSVQMEGPLSHGGGIIAGVRRSYFDAVVRPFAPDDTPLPSYLDVQVKTGWGDARDKGRVTPMIFGSVDRVANDETAITSAFLRIAAPYHRQWGALGLHVVPWLGLNDLRFHDRDTSDPVGMQREQTFSRPTFPWGVRAELIHDYPWGHLRGGAEYSGGYLAQSSYDPGGNGNFDNGPSELTGNSTVAWSDIALWGEARRELFDGKVSLKPGVRMELYGLTSGVAMSSSGPLTAGGWLGTSVGNGPQIVLDPRLNASYMLDATTTVRAAVGRFHQPPTPADVQDSGNPGLDSSYVDQSSLGIETTWNKDVFASLTAFAHYGRDIGIIVRDPRPGSTPPDSSLSFGGLGPTFQLLLEKQLGFAQYREALGNSRSYGLEMMAKRTTADWFTMASYTFAVSERRDINPITGGELKWRPFELDQRHNLQLMVSRRWPKWRIGARFQMVSGNPYSPSVFHGDFVDPTPIPFGARLPTFYTLDMRFDRRWHRCWGDINLYFDIQNITNHYNVEGREYDSNEQRDADIGGLPIIPFIGVEFLPLI
ncbi:MAG TPA: TonB-dependent receptor [Kofleriaceae bacterium]